MAHGGKRDGSGRPKTNRIPVEVSFTAEGLDRIDYLRGSKPRGVFIEEHIMAIPLPPFAKFTVMRGGRSKTR